MKVFLKILKLNSDYEKLFFLNEYKTLLGRNSRIIGFLIVILFLTFLALGYSIGSIQYLEKRMSNPYTNWVDLTVAESMGIDDNVVHDLLFQFPEEDKAKFHINDIRGSVGYRPDFYRSDFSPVDHGMDTLWRTIKSITVGTDDLLFDRIVSEDNAIWVKPGLTYNCEDCLKSCQVILTEKAMSLLKLDADNQDLSNVLLKDRMGVIPIEVVAVVKSLPKFYEMACSPEFANINDFDGEEYISGFKEGDNSCMFLVDESIPIKKLDSLRNAFFKASVEVEFEGTIVSGEQRWNKALMYFSATSPPPTETIYDFIEFSRKNGAPIGLMAEYSCNAEKLDRLPTVHNIAFNFTDLNEIRSFKEFMLQEKDVEIDTKQIEVKENFALVSSLTWTISVILLTFGVLSIILFVNNLLRTHLFKVRTNLGTFKAFGLSNSFLNTIYLKIISVFLIIAIAVAFGLTALVDLVEHFILEESKFNIFSPWVLIAIFLLVAVSLYISFRTSKKILGDTPGNLIYNR